MAENRKFFTLKQVAEHKKEDDCWFVIHGKVYDVTQFLSEHPGGEEVLLQTAGTDATDEFEDVGHSNSAKLQMESFYVGECSELGGGKGDHADPIPDLKSTTVANSGAQVSIFSKILQFVVPLVLLGIAVAIRNYGKKAV